MKTIVKIDPDKEYNNAKLAISELGLGGDMKAQISSLDQSVDNLKTVINVLLERATPRKRTKPPRKSNKKKSKGSKAPDLGKLPSQKFPELEIKENIISDAEPPECSGCHQPMTESGLYKISEKLEVIPKQYFINRNKRVIYTCSCCHESMKNASVLPSIAPCSNYGDSMIIDASLSKYCDLIPMERYCDIAARDGLEGLPPNSLIGVTHKLADFLLPVYEKIRAEILSAKVVFMDETPHKMLEGDQTANWYLWGFLSKHGCIFEAHGTRSGEVPLAFLRDSAALYLLTDGYGGYKKSIRLLAAGGKDIEEVYCNAHAYRYFEEASVTWESETLPFLETYGKIYELERAADTDEQLKKARQDMKKHFKNLEERCEAAIKDAMPNSYFAKALGYFLNHCDGLKKCTENIEIPLTNNYSERTLRSPVLGRKTWYGTHSKRGARTNAVLFSVVESCKINSVNPRAYFPWILERIHGKKDILTPYEYASQIDSG